MTTTTKTPNGVSQKPSNGKWIFHCEHCGMTSTELDSRDKAREAYRIHRREICGKTVFDQPTNTDVAPANAEPEQNQTQDTTETDLTPTEAQATSEEATVAKTQTPAKGKKSTTQKAKPEPKAKAEGKTFRIAFLKNPKSQRVCSLTVRQDGLPQGAKYQEMFPGRADKWVEVQADSFKSAVKAVKEGQGKTVKAPK